MSETTPEGGNDATQDVIEIDSTQERIDPETLRKNFVEYIKKNVQVDYGEVRTDPLNFFAATREVTSPDKRHAKHIYREYYVPDPASKGLSFSSMDQAEIWEVYPSSQDIENSKKSTSIYLHQSTEPKFRNYVSISFFNIETMRQNQFKNFQLDISHVDYLSRVPQFVTSYVHTPDVNEVTITLPQNGQVNIRLPDQKDGVVESIYHQEMPELNNEVDSTNDIRVNFFAVESRVNEEGTLAAINLHDKESGELVDTIIVPLYIDPQELLTSLVSPELFAAPYDATTTADDLWRKKSLKTMFKKLGFNWQQHAKEMKIRKMIQDAGEGKEDPDSSQNDHQSTT